MRAALKKALLVVAMLTMAPLSVPVRLVAPWDRDDRVFSFASELVSLLPGWPGMMLRWGFYAVVLPTGAPSLHLGFCSVIAQRDVSIGRDVYIGAFCTIGRSTIEDNVLIGSHVDIVSGRYFHYFDRPDIPIREQGGELKKIVIGRGAWIANNATVLESVGEGCVVAAGAVVVSPCEPMGIYAGNPARRLRRRGEINPEASARYST
jgi:virginiamycin A acetyltransferase